MTIIDRSDRVLDDGGHETRLWQHGREVAAVFVCETQDDACVLYDRILVLLKAAPVSLLIARMRDEP